MVALGSRLKNVGGFVSTMVAVLLTGVVCYCAGTLRSLFLGAGALFAGASLVAALLLKMSQCRQSDHGLSTTPSSTLETSDNSPESCNVVIEQMSHIHFNGLHSDEKPPSYEEVYQSVSLDDFYI